MRGGLFCESGDLFCLWGGGVVLQSTTFVTALMRKKTACSACGGVSTLFVCEPNELSAVMMRSLSDALA